MTAYNVYAYDADGNLKAFAENISQLSADEMSKMYYLEGYEIKVKKVK
jgi:hypothetical protein